MWAWLLLALHRAGWSRCEENERAGEGDGAEKARRTHRSSDRLTWINMETPTYDSYKNHRVLTTISFSVWPHIQQSGWMHYVSIHYIMSLRGSWFTTTTLMYTTHNKLGILCFGSFGIGRQLYWGDIHPILCFSRNGLTVYSVPYIIGPIPKN